MHRVRFAPVGESYTCGSEDRSTRIWQTGPSSQEHDSSMANGPEGEVKGTTEEVALLIYSYQ